MGYAYYYNRARNKYYDACSKINSCENKINQLKIQRQQKINQINQLKTDIKNHENAFDEVSELIKGEENLNEKVLGISNKTNQSAVNFSGMVHSSNITNKNLDDVYGVETTNTKQTLNNILQALKAKKNELSIKIANLKKELHRAESELQDIENSIRTTQSDLQSWKRAKKNASIDMAYYRRKMDEED